MFMVSLLDIERPVAERLARMLRSKGKETLIRG